MATIEVKDSQENEDLIRIVNNQENREFEKALCFFISFEVLRLQIGV